MLFKYNCSLYGFFSKKAYNNNGTWYWILEWNHMHLHLADSRICLLEYEKISFLTVLFLSQISKNWNKESAQDQTWSYQDRNPARNTSKKSTNILYFMYIPVILLSYLSALYIYMTAFVYGWNFFSVLAYILNLSIQ